MIWFSPFVLLLLVSFARAPLTATVNVCKIGGVIFAQTRGEYFVAVAAADTVETGRGIVEPGVGDFTAGQGVQRRVYGQLFHLQVFSSRLQEVVERSGKSEIVVVPWSFGPDCQPTYWEGSAQWMAAGSVSFQVAHLRPADLWLNGLPTLDIFRVPVNSYVDTGSADSVNAYEFYSLYDLLPGEGEWLRRDSVALRRVEAWAATNRNTAAKAPASYMLAALRRWYERRR